MGEENIFTKKGLAFLMFYIFVVFIGGSYVYASDSESFVFTSQSASSNGSNDSLISVDSNLSYINKGQNSSIIGNYFSGYYYDSMLGYFQMDFSGNESENVRIIGSTGICSNDYGYILGGYSYSEEFGYIDFDYNSDIFVYYCIEDEKLHGYAYNSFLGLQSFEGITFDINVEASLLSVEEPTGTGIFINDETEIFNEGTTLEVTGAIETAADDSSINYNTIQNDVLEFDGKYESLFYIIK